MVAAELGSQSLSVLDSMHQHIALLDRFGNLQAVNRAWRQFGLRNGLAGSSESSIGLNYLSACDGVDAPPEALQARQGVQAVLAGELPHFELEYPCPDNNGQEFWFLMRVSPLTGGAGGAVVSHEDITSRWRLEKQRASLMQELLDIKAALDAHAMVAMTDSRGRITYVNDKFCAISKWSREELIGKDHRIINSGHHSKALIADLWATIRDGRIWKGEIKNVAKDGSPYWVDTTIVPSPGADGKPHQYTAIRAEITRRKELEERNEAMVSELLAANRELREFAHVVSHDLKAPLRGISALATWLVDDHAAKLGEEGAAQLKLIVARAKRLSALIDGILAYSRIGRTPVETQAVALDALVRNTIDLLNPPAHVSVQVLGALPRMWLPAVKIQQVFQNLLSNAIDFMDKPQGLITVACRREGAEWLFSVADNGPGIDERHFERIFQLFQTLNGRDERERTGVGLALVKKIVELEGGRLWLESVVGSGTTFHFTLPAAAEPGA
jgi:PAS domain S-box-containing protein